MGSSAFNELLDVILDIIAEYALIAVMMYYGLIIIRAILVDMLKIEIPSYVELLSSILLPAVVTIDFARDTMISERNAYICVFLRTVVLLVLLGAVLKWLYEIIAEYRSQKSETKKPSIKIAPSINTVTNPSLNNPAAGKKPVVPKQPTEEAISKITKYNEQNFGGFNYGKFEPNFKTRTGEYVYSPGEMLISCKLLDAGISYEYCRKLQLEETISVIPTFTIKITDYGKRVFWEHFPSFTHEGNSNRWRYKLRLYESHKIILGNNLFLTTDDDFREIDACIAMIQNLINPKVQGETNKDCNSDNGSGVSQLEPIKEDIICDGKSFMDYFATDIGTYNRRLVIFSPFIGDTRLPMLLPLFDNAIGQGKQIVVVTKDISCRKKEDRDKCRKLEPILWSHGVRIVYRGDMHEKLVFVDHDAVWVGSLNALSFTGATGEVMHRHTDQKTVAKYAKMYQIDGI